MGEDPVLVQSQGEVVTISLNRPRARNAFDARLLADLGDAFRRLAGQPRARAVVLAGSGPVFCAGADLAWMSAASSEQGRLEDAELLLRTLRAIDECPVPVVARVHGAALGGGLGLLAVSDVVAAADDARLALREVRVGLAPSVIAPFMLRQMGPSQFRRFALTAEPFSPADARAFGLVHAVVPARDLDDRVAEITAQLRQGGPEALRATKHVIRRLLEPSATDGWGLCVRTNAELRASAEAKEGMRAFLEKRPPSWAAAPSKPEPR